jgi:hypothetical protein
MGQITARGNEESEIRDDRAEEQPSGHDDSMTKKTSQQDSQHAVTTMQTSSRTLEKLSSSIARVHSMQQTPRWCFSQLAKRGVIRKTVHGGFRRFR